jgi:hypothetical protein
LILLLSGQATTSSALASPLYETAGRSAIVLAGAVLPVIALLAFVCVELRVVDQ